MVGAGDEDHIITRVLPGTDPLQEFDKDDPEDIIAIDHKTDDCDVDDLSEASMVSADAMTKEQLQGLLVNMAASHHKNAEAVDALAVHVGEMSTDQLDQAATLVVTEMGHIRGLNKITQAFDRAEIGLILATGVRKLHEYQCLKGKREEADIIPYSQLGKSLVPTDKTSLIVLKGISTDTPRASPQRCSLP